MKRLLILLLLLAAIAAGCELGDEKQTVTETETVEVVPVPDGAGGVELDPDQEQTELERPEGFDAHEDSKDETPPGVTPEDVERIEQSRPKGIGPPGNLGGAENLSCPVRLVRNHSARASGSRVSMFALHYTVSDPGSFNAIWGLFNTASFAASSTYLLEPLTGRCEQLVPFDRKPWTQGAFNSVSESVEIVCCRTDPSRAWWLSTKIIREGLLAQMIANRLKARGLPNRLVDPVGCTPLAGWTDHNRLECGNTHVDVGKNFPFDVLKRQIAAHFQPARTVVWRVSAGGEILHQRKVVPGDKPTTYQRVVTWIRQHPAVVSAAEAKHTFVSLRKITIPAT